MRYLISWGPGRTATGTVDVVVEALQRRELSDAECFKLRPRLVSQPDGGNSDKGSFTLSCLETGNKLSESSDYDGIRLDCVPEDQILTCHLNDGIVRLWCANLFLMLRCGRQRRRTLRWTATKKICIFWPAAGTRMARIDPDCR